MQTTRLSSLVAVAALVGVALPQAAHSQVILSTINDITKQDAILKFGVDLLGKLGR